ncbi:hypothetical protein [Marihabitans asiaticum]|uniref:hypothetical protein n=1 Tax=Marihabitans asiaticum TaxID=415218 RepID=UPI0011A689FC
MNHQVTGLCQGPLDLAERADEVSFDAEAWVASVGAGSASSASAASDGSASQGAAHSAGVSGTSGGLGSGAVIGGLGLVGLAAAAVVAVAVVDDEPEPPRAAQLAPFAPVPCVVLVRPVERVHLDQPYHDEHVTERRRDRPVIVHRDPSSPGEAHPDVYLALHDDPAPDELTEPAGRPAGHGRPGPAGRWRRGVR